MTSVLRQNLLYLIFKNALLQITNNFLTVTIIDAILTDWRGFAKVLHKHFTPSSYSWPKFKKSKFLKGAKRRKNINRSGFLPEPPAGEHNKILGFSAMIFYLFKWKTQIYVDLIITFDVTR